MADLYTIWANKEGDISDIDFVNNMRGFLQHLVDEGKMLSFRITRCKMGFRSVADMPEWFIIMEFKDKFYGILNKNILNKEIHKFDDFRKILSNISSKSI